MRQIAFLALFLLAHPAWGRAATRQQQGLADKTPNSNPDALHVVGPELAVVTAHLARRTIQRGEDLAVKVTITAGAHGAWIPNAFGDWDATCQSGFAVQFLTLQGDSASTEVRGCAGSFPGPGPKAEELLKDYVFLKRGESRSWRTTLTQLTTKPGTYEVRAEYFTAQNRIEEVALLPVVRGLMVIGHVKAKPLRVRIR